MSKSIPIQNLWFLLLYASEYVHENTANRFDTTRADGLENLISIVLADHLDDYLNQHLRKQLRSKQAELGVIKGKINHYQTTVRQSLSKGRVFCSYNEATYNITRHAYMLSAVELVLKLKIEKKAREKLSRIQFEFKSYGVVSSSLYRFEKDHFSSFEHVCKKAIYISKLIHDMQIMATQFGDHLQPELMLSDEKLRKVFEKGIAGFFKFNLDKTIYRVVSGKGSRIDLDLQFPINGIERYFPNMTLDMMIRSKDMLLVIDTKFADMLKSQYQGTPKIKSDYIRQIYTYVMSYKIKEPENNCSGMLLYPAIDQNYAMSIEMLSVPLHFYTVDLSKKISEIHQELIKIIDTIFNPVTFFESTNQ